MADRFAICLPFALAFGLLGVATAKGPEGEV
jgi:hypothetical protein